MKDSSSHAWTPDASQQQVIAAHGGHHLVLAPPGCGKTQILTERLRQAHAAGVAFADMLCLTFTNRAARGMSERISQHIAGADVRDLFVGNVHRYCSRFLFSSGLVAAESSVVDEEDSISILARFLNEDEYEVLNHYQRRREYNGVFHLANFMYQIRHRHPKALRVHPECITADDVLALRTICQVSRMDFTPEAMTDIYDHSDTYTDILQSAQVDHGMLTAAQRLFRRMTMARQFDAYKRENHLLDFNDLLTLTYEALTHDTAGAFKRYRWIQIDEVQDLNPLQMAIVDLLTASDADTVMYLGDEQQAIFSFMGAKLDTLAALRKRCGANVHHLSVNHRSPRYLLDIFNTYAQSAFCIDPSLLPTTDYNPVRQGNELCLLYSQTYDSEVRDIAQFAGQLCHNFPNETTAVIVNSNRDAEEISQSLHDQHLDHFKVSGNDLFSQPEVKLLMAHLSVLANELGFIAWARLLRGLNVFHENASARKLVRELLDRAILPSDLLRFDGTDTYLQQFVRTYEDREIVVFDTETTGLNVTEDDIVQIAAVKMRHGHVVEGSELSLYITTDREIPARLGDIENPIIEERRHHRLLDPAEALQQFIDYAEGGILLGHNADYDYNILQYNLRRYCPHIDLHERHPHYLDSLRLVRMLHPELPQHKLKYLLEALQLEGSNSHLADEDVQATCSVVRHCYEKGKDLVGEQIRYLSERRVRERVEVLRRNYRDTYLAARERLYRHEPERAGTPVLVDELQTFYFRMVSEGYICELPGAKYIFSFLAHDLLRPSEEPTLQAQIAGHMVEMMTLKEADLCGSRSIDDRIFVTTIHKAKGLEFDNVIVFDAIDGRMPSYYNRNDPRLMAEDARKFYVAITRARRRLYVSQCLLRIDTYNGHHDVHLTPFMSPVVESFDKYRADCTL